jgi:hypothetical protein
MYLSGGKAHVNCMKYIHEAIQEKPSGVGFGTDSLSGVCNCPSLEQQKIGLDPPSYPNTVPQMIISYLPEPQPVSIAIWNSQLLEQGTSIALLAYHGRRPGRLRKTIHFILTFTADL